MKTVIFSDTHLSKKFDVRKFNILKKIISGADRVILNGDIWDGYNTKFGDFINSKWQRLFPILKNKKTVYIEGNHDPFSLIDERANLFSDKQVKEYYFESGGYQFKVQHYWEDLAKFQRADSRLVQFLLVRLFIKVVNIFEGLQDLFFHFSLLSLNGWRNNRRFIKKYTKKPQKHQGKPYLICGHTHIPIVNHKVRYLNCGAIMFRRFSYLVIEDGEIRLEKGRY